MSALGAGRHEARAAIASCALTVLRERGEMGLSVRTVAERLGITAGTIYNYFDSKDELLLVLADRALWGINEEIDRLVGDRTGADALRAMALACIRFAREHPAEFRLATSLWTGGHWVPQSEAGDVFFTRLNGAIRQLGRQTGMEVRGPGERGTGAAPPEDRRTGLAVGIAALLQGIPLVAAGPAGWDPADDETVITTTLDAFLRGAAPTP